MEDMTRLWQERMATLGWTVPAEDFSWGTTLDDNLDITIKLHSQTLKRVKKAAGFNLFGTILAFDRITNA